MRVEPGSPAKSPPAAVAEKAGNPTEGLSMESVHPLAPGYHNRLAFPEMDDHEFMMLVWPDSLRELGISNESCAGDLIEALLGWHYILTIKRLYIVCVARGHSDAASRFAWPLPSAPSPGALLKRVFDKGSETLATYAQYPLPLLRQMLMRKNVGHVLTQVRGVFAGRENRLTRVPILIDGGYMKYTWHIKNCMCITASHAANTSIWSLQHGRPLSTTELAKLQRISGPILARLDYSTMTERQMNERIGNAFTLTVYKNILIAGLRACSLMC